MELFTLFLLFIFSAIGFTHIMVDSSMMAPWREWAKEHLPEKVFWFHPREAVECYQCMGFWCGLIVGVLNCVVLYRLGIKDWWVLSLIPLCCGWAGSFLSLVGAFLISCLEAHSIIDMKKIKIDDEDYGEDV